MISVYRRRFQAAQAYAKTSDINSVIAVYLTIVACNYVSVACNYVGVVLARPTWIATFLGVPFASQRPSVPGPMAGSSCSTSDSFLAGPRRSFSRVARRLFSAATSPRLEPTLRDDDHIAR